MIHPDHVARRDPVLGQARGIALLGGEEVALDVAETEPEALMGLPTARFEPGLPVGVRVTVLLLADWLFAASLALT